MICNSIGLTTDSFEAIYTTGGIEISEIYAGVNYTQPIYYKSRTFIGNTPFVYDSYPGQLKNITIYGNSYQNGTPSPEQPVDIISVGDLVTSGEHAGEYLITVKTYGENLYKKENFVVGKAIDDNGDIVPYSSAWYGVTSGLSCDGAERLYVSNQIGGGLSVIAFYKKNGVFIKTEAYWKNSSIKVPEDAAVFYCFLTTTTAGKVTGDAADTVITKEPVTTTPIYLSEPLRRIGEYADELDLANGTVTRRIKEVILTGNENNWMRYNVTYYRPFAGILTNVYANVAVCNTFRYKYDVIPVLNAFTKGVNENLVFNYDNTGDHINDFKAWLSQLYADGTPIIVYHALSNPVTESITFPQITTINGQNILSIGTTLQPYTVSITGHIKESSIYGDLSDVNNTLIIDTNNEQIQVTG